uniref:Uncharacterized protein n=1 Tax=Siphoviridae sp. ctP0x5 TaxID=2827863 RepID=A0A8S5TFH6_9CAUD|nr:MAG TPA: hypothetical protein [Siphoviridae sp. ctP0x5]
MGSYQIVKSNFWFECLVYVYFCLLLIYFYWYIVVI